MSRALNGGGVILLSGKNRATNIARGGIKSSSFELELDPGSRGILVQEGINEGIS